MRTGHDGVRAEPVQLGRGRLAEENIDQMDLRPLRRAATLAIAGTLTFAGVAAADTVRAAGDAVIPGPSPMIDLGEVAPSAVVTVDVPFELVCTSVNHVDAGQSVTLTLGVESAPSGGAVVSVTQATVGPAPNDWPSDDEDCPFPAPTLSGGPSTVTLVAPAVPNAGYMYTIGYVRSISPVGSNDGGALTGSFTAINLRLDVVTNSEPKLGLPADQTVEGDTAGGWIATYPGVSASDAEDNPDPVPSCTPTPGTVLPLGTTTVDCTVTDSGGKSAAGSFDVTVVDTTAPTITGVPGDIDIPAAGPGGAVVTYPTPTASDVVDPAPSVSCSPSSGSTLPVGVNTVSCDAADASGNHAGASFRVTVTAGPTGSAEATWLEPVGSGVVEFEANRGRTLPIKVVLRVDGVVRNTGAASITVTPCAGGVGLVLPMDLHGGRWNASLDTSGLVGSCHVVAASIDGIDAGSFTLVLRGSEPAAAKGAKRR